MCVCVCVCTCTHACVCVCVQSGLFQPCDTVCVINLAPLCTVSAGRLVPFAGCYDAAGGTNYVERDRLQMDGSKLSV